MPVGLNAPGELLPVAGVRVSAVAAGVRYPDRADLALFELAEGTRTACVFTRNAFRAAPVEVAQAHLASAAPRFLLVNAGNANAGTGAAGLRDATACCAGLAAAAGCAAEAVLPFSTGVIGESLPVARIRDALPVALEALDPSGWLGAARAIMTTDTLPKAISVRQDVGGQSCTVTGIAKGAGMICPDMATMLAFVTTDAQVEADVLERCLHRAVERSFNRITVDGDTSTNDACLLAATGRGPARVETDAEEVAFAAALDQVFGALARAIVRDGEGATKFVTVEVEGGRDPVECRQVAYTVAHSPLVKTALFASDPNWGRILAAVGRSGLPALDVAKVRIFLGDTCIVEDGGRAAGYTEEAGAAVMEREEIGVRVHLGRGDARATVWTTDLSHDYVRINAEYRT